MRLKLSDPVTKLPFVGKTYAGRLKRLEIKTVRDLLYHFPFRYQDFSKTKKIKDLNTNDEVTISGEVIKTEVIRAKKGTLLTRAAVADETGAIEAVWFNQPYLAQTLKERVKIQLAGRIEPFGRKLSFVSPEYEIVKEGRTPTHTKGLIPVYPETSRVSSKWLRTRIRNVLGEIPLRSPKFEFIPEKIRKEESLPLWGDALNSIHFPKTKKEVQKARRRFAFEELFLLNLRSLKRRQSWESKELIRKISVEENRERVDQFIKNLPFTLTKAQQRAVEEILGDLKKSTPMNRLLEGDVGAGKTVVAAVAAYTCFLNGERVVIMAPTEILADQHAKTLNQLLAPYGIECILHTGSKKTSEKICDLWIGTHALFYRKGSFEDVALMIIDEQHRFGVEQRARLIRKTKSAPHVLTLTATPIPRSLALTVYGDLDLSVLDELPPGRKRVKTFVVPNGKREAGYEWIRKQVKLGNQAFIICPLIEESEKETMQQVKAAAAEYEKLQKNVFPNLSLGLLHGRLKIAEKEEVIEGFREGKHQILVSTPVVEVGIDIPNATIMVIEAAERFGLASLHQLRGRVGRGEKESYCFLFTQKAGRNAYKRLKALESTASGFKLAELDLRLRGPGEIYGTRQHGLTELKVADLSDTPFLKTTQDYARQVMDKGLGKELNQELKRFTTTLVEPN